jgi:hypothetical protein
MWELYAQLLDLWSTHPRLCHDVWYAPLPTAHIVYAVIDNSFQARTCTMKNVFDVKSVHNRFPVPCMRVPVKASSV